MSADAVLDALVTSCVVVTGADPRPRGCLVGSVMPVGRRTPAVAFALVTGSRTERAVSAGGLAALNLLAADDVATATVFSTDVDRFDAVAWTPGASGVPLLDAAVGTAELVVTARCGSGGDTVFCGEVRHAGGWPTRILTMTDARAAGLEPARTSPGAGP